MVGQGMRVWLFLVLQPRLVVFLVFLLDITSEGQHELILFT